LNPYNGQTVTRLMSVANSKWLVIEVPKWNLIKAFKEECPDFCAPSVGEKLFGFLPKALQAIDGKQVPGETTKGLAAIILRLVKRAWVL
jgi:hypothetical protein